MHALDKYPLETLMTLNGGRMIIMVFDKHMKFSGGIDGFITQLLVFSPVNS